MLCRQSLKKTERCKITESVRSCPFASHTRQYARYFQVMLVLLGHFLLPLSRGLSLAGQKKSRSCPETCKHKYPRLVLAIFRENQKSRTWSCGLASSEELACSFSFYTLGCGLENASILSSVVQSVISSANDSCRVSSCVTAFVLLKLLETMLTQKKNGSSVNLKGGGQLATKTGDGEQM